MAKAKLRNGHFKDTFVANLALAKAVYRAANVDFDERGVTLYPSDPPVPPTKDLGRHATKVLSLPIR